MDSKTTPKCILVVAGGLGVGKGTATTYMKETYGATTLEFSGALRSVLARLYLPIDRTHMVSLSKGLRELFGNDILARVMAEDARTAETNLLVLDGARRLGDISHIKDDPRFRLAYIDADPAKRFERIVKRSQNEGDDKKTYDDFLKDLQAETELSIAALLPLAHVTWMNNGTQAEFFAQIDAFMKQEGIAPKNL